ncbi:MAG TPA: replicative DNA helicase [Candidatus Paceibacterota bacterium]|nr:replicative DNA helicase [Candidatus Paceibacterota bacterium]
MFMVQGIKNNLRTPPHDTDAEKAFLGSILLRSQSIPDVADMLDPDSFYSGKNSVIYKTIFDLYTKGEPIDLVSLSSRLKEKGQLEQAGGASYLAELINTVPSSTNVEHYAKIIQKKSLLRKLIESGDHVSELGFNEHREIEDVLVEAEKKILGVSGSLLKNKFIPIRNTLTEAWERLDRLHNSSDEIRGIPTGFKGLDNKLAGLQKSDLIILAARPSVGKTSLALDLARQAACKYNVPVGIFSLEMASQQLADRMVAAESGVDSWKLRTGKISSDEEFIAIREAMDKLNKAPIHIDDEASNNILRMRSVARKLQRDQGLGLIIVDYLQLMVPQRHSDSLVQQVTEISRSLKILARELDVPVLALSQLNRQVEQRGGPPRLSDLRDSGSIEQDADVVLFIHREDKNDKNAPPNIAKIIIAKHRNGPTGETELFFDAERVSFMDLDKSAGGDESSSPSDNAGFGDF